MAYRIDKHPDKGFDPGCLYIVASLPRRLPYAEHDLAKYPAYLPEDFNAGSYETGTATGRASEEFEWSVYYHESSAGGTWYRLIKDLSDFHHGPCPDPKPPTYTLERKKIRGGSMRLEFEVVAVFAVMYLPANLACLAESSSANIANEESRAAFHIPRYLDWLTSCTAPRATRTFIWGVSIFLRCRMHICNQVETSDDLKTFDVKEFLREALTVCYPEIYEASRPILPRPVFLSGFSIHMLDGDNDDGSLMLFAVNSVHLRLPPPELEPETPSSPVALSSVAGSSDGYGESLYSEECEPDSFYQRDLRIWPAQWLSPEQVCNTVKMVATLAMGEETYDDLLRELTATDKIGKTQVQDAATAYNTDFPPLPPSSTKLLGN